MTRAEVTSISDEYMRAMEAAWELNKVRIEKTIVIDDKRTTMIIDWYDFDWIRLDCEAAMARLKSQMSNVEGFR